MDTRLDETAALVDGFMRKLEAAARR